MCFDDWRLDWASAGWADGNRWNSPRGCHRPMGPARAGTQHKFWKMTQTTWPSMSLPRHHAADRRIGGMCEAEVSIENWDGFPASAVMATCAPRRSATPLRDLAVAATHVDADLFHRRSPSLVPSIKNPAMEAGHVIVSDQAEVRQDQLWVFAAFSQRGPDSCSSPPVARCLWLL